MVHYLSSAPYFLYEDCEWIDCEQVKTLRKNFLQRSGQACPMFIVYGPENIDRTKPNIVSKNIEWKDIFLQLCNKVKTYSLPSYASVLKDVFINNNAVYFGGSIDTFMLYEIHRPNDRPSTAVNYQINLRANININSFVDNKTYFYIGSAGVNNYGHWLVDDLPRLKGIEIFIESNPTASTALLLTSSSDAINKVKLETIRLHPKLKDIEVCFLDPSQNYRFESIYYISPVSYHPEIKLRSSLKYVHDTYVTNTLNAENNPRNRVYVTRKSESGRRLINAEEIEVFLLSKGFVIVDCTNLSFKEQVDYFSGAEIIVGVMGAAMTNCVFSAEGTTEIHLACEGWIEPFYWDLADGCNHIYYGIYGKQNESGAPYNVSFYIDVNDIADTLAKCGII